MDKDRIEELKKISNFVDSIIKAAEAKKYPGKNTEATEHGKPESNLGKIIQDALNDKGISIKELEDKIGSREPFLHEVITGKMKYLPMIKRAAICVVLNIPIEDLNEDLK